MVQIARIQLFLVKRKEHVSLNSKGKINMSNVYFVSSFSFNLLSIGSIIDMDFILLFDDKGWTIYQGKKIIGA